jgi:hypothetical protein
MESIPVLGEFVVNSAERDIADFNGYSAMFTVDYFASIRAKIEVCAELIKSTLVSNELKAVTIQLHGKAKAFRVKLNALEGCLKLGAGKLDVAIEDIGLKNIKSNISGGNVEKMLSSMQISLKAIRRNLPALKAQGLTPTLIDDIESHLREIRILREKQKALKSRRTSLTTENIDKFYDLWNNLRLIMNTAKVIYRDVDEVRLQDYNIAILKKRIKK